ncbi:MAG TPA: amidohydrolase family protein, partial [Candidatus Glassbacteria bacterium]|nr:amidohydrolase family protein [Candidatus Glassbacteria bacterium]
MKRISSYIFYSIVTAVLLFLPAGCSAPQNPADLIFYNGRVVTVDSAFSVAGAAAVKGERIEAVGTDKEILALAGPETKKIDLAGRSLLPGLIEAHAHPDMASLSEIDRPLSNPRTVKECLEWISGMVKLKSPGEWIVHPKLFATRLAELRPPTLAELDSVAPDNPVFLNGSYGGSVNSAALAASGVTQKTDHSGLLRDPDTGRLNGKLHFTALPLLKLPKKPVRSIPERAQALAKMLALYNRVGFTSFTDGEISLEDTVLYKYLKDNGNLTLRAYLNVYNPVEFEGRPLEDVLRDVRSLGVKTGDGDEWVRIGALKTLIDGGILTGTAYLRQPWGPKAREIFGVVDPEYRGIPRMSADEFYVFARAGAEAGWKITAHVTGGAGVDLMLDAFERVNESAPVKPLRCSFIHGNFFDRQ